MTHIFLSCDCSSCHVAFFFLLCVNLLPSCYVVPSDVQLLKTNLCLTQPMFEHYLVYCSSVCIMSKYLTHFVGLVCTYVVCLEEFLLSICNISSMLRYC